MQQRAFCQRAEVSANLTWLGSPAIVVTVGEQDPNPAVIEAAPLSVAIALTTDPSTTRGLLDEFCYALGLATGINVEPRGVLPAPQLLQELAEGAVHLVWLPPILALRATASASVVPIALPVRNGTSLYRAVLYTRPDSPLRTVADLSAVRAAWIHHQSATGYLIIRAHLEALGVVLREAFAEELFLGTHDDVTKAVLDGRADVGATYLYLDEDAPEARPLRAGWGEAEVVEITRSGPIPADVLATGEHTSAEVQKQLQRALIDEPTPELRRATRELLAADSFRAPMPEHLEPLQRLLGGMPEGACTPHSLFPPPPKLDR